MPRQKTGSQTKLIRIPVEYESEIKAYLQALKAGQVYSPIRETTGLVSRLKFLIKTLEAQSTDLERYQQLLISGASKKL